MNAPQPLLQRALGWAITFVVIALLIRWGWDILQPLFPYIVGGVAIALIGGMALRYHNNRYW